MNPRIAQFAREIKRGKKITALTAYDYPMARLLDESGIDIILVGDSVGMVVLGHSDTTSVTMQDMIHHCRAAARGTKNALLVCDLPIGSYETAQEAVVNSLWLVDAGAHAVKLEGGERSARTIESIVRAGIPVMGHIGLTPQSIHQLGGHRVQGKTREAGRRLLSDALAVQQAGAFAMVLELVPEQLATAITERLHVPTIGIGAGAGCSGQVQVITDLLGMSSDFTPKHARHYVELHTVIGAAAEAYRTDVAAGTFPGPAESTRMDDGILDEILGRTRLDRPEDIGVLHGIPLDRDL